MARAQVGKWYSRWLFIQLFIHKSTWPYMVRISSDQAPPILPICFSSRPGTLSHHNWIVHNCPCNCLSPVSPPLGNKGQAVVQHGWWKLTTCTAHALWQVYNISTSSMVVPPTLRGSESLCPSQRKYPLLVMQSIDCHIRPAIKCLCFSRGVVLHCHLLSSAPWNVASSILSFKAIA